MSTISKFNLDALMSSEITEAQEKRPPIPVGTYQARIKTLVPGTWAKKDGTDSGVKFDLTLEVTIPSDVQGELGIQESTVILRDSIMLNLNAAGGIDTSPGKNARLRTYRIACGMNVQSQPFSPPQFVGKGVSVTIKHEMYEGEIQEKIGAVTEPE